MAVHDQVLVDGVRLFQLDAIVRVQSATGWDTVRVAELLTALSGVLVSERARIGDVMTGNEIGRVSLEDAFAIVAQLAQAHAASLVDALALKEQLDTAIGWLLVDKLAISDKLGGNGIYHASFADTARLVVSLLNFYGADITDALGIEGDLAAAALLKAGVQDGIAIAPVMQPLLLISAHAEDGVELDQLDAVQMLFNPTILERVALKAGYLAPDGSFTTWAMNTRTGAVTEYANYAFNSFAKIGRRVLGASENGLYELTGDSDDGTSIAARIAGGFLQFGGTQLSRLKEAYIAARGEQEWVLRVITGDGEVYNYRVTNRSMRSTKVHMGKGQRARYFAYELVSTGADFDLDTLEFVPIVMQRRV